MSHPASSAETTTPSLLADASWRPEYAIGVAEIDQQHRYLLHLIAQLNQLDQGWLGHFRQQPRLHKLLDEFNEYAAFHFLTEEKLMHQHLPANSELAQHLALHRNYWQRIHELRQRQENGDKEIALDLLRFLNHWWLDHILHTDREAGQQLNQRGIF